MNLLVKDAFEAKIGEVRRAVYDLFYQDDDDFNEIDIGVVYTFPDAVIIKDYDSEDYYLMNYSRINDEIIFSSATETDMIFVTKRLMEENPNLTLKGIRAIVDLRDQWAGDFTQGVKSLTGTPGVDNPEALCAWLFYQTEGMWPAEKERAQKAASVELTGPIVMKNDLKQIAYAAVLVPGEIDYDGESVTKERIEDAAHEWMEMYQNVDLQHTLNNVGVPVESYLTPAEMTVTALDGEVMVLPEGTWILGSRLDDATWKGVQDKLLTGYSVMGMKRAALKSAQESAVKSDTGGSGASVALKKTLLRDLGPDWVPVYVSVVDRPAVPKAKFFALKAADSSAVDSSESKPWYKRLAELLGSRKAKSAAGKKPDDVKFSDEAFALLKGLIADAEKAREKGGDGDMNEEQVKALVTEAVTEAVKTALEEAVDPLKEEIASVKASLEGDAGKDGAKDAGAKDDGDAGAAKDADAKDDGDDGKDAELEAFKSEVNTQLDALFKKLGVDSKALKGQDGEGEEGSKKGGYVPPEYAPIQRDIHGRRVRSQKQL